MAHDEQRVKRIAMIKRNPVGYLDSALKTLKTCHCEQLVDCLYVFERLGSGKAGQLLGSTEETASVRDQIPAGLWLKHLPPEERDKVKLTLSTFGININRKSTAEVIAEVEAKLQELLKA
ncbi:hypothetical protein [Desulfoferrobacter suflitae]|uniref:hypothetical protein n=1 Tax=Desulfoferrobacter suflitae TaxID=2865782 RepID=UPI0021648651|nr:hypothetical protein [Desulfoferrobacter suflitae]MCK8602869.1 hypothetical protein [Desulfoferrobacter suflitae]